MFFQNDFSNGLIWRICCIVVIARDSQSSGCFEFCFFNLIEPKQAIKLTKQFQKHVLPNQLDNMFFSKHNLTQLFIK